MQKLTILILAAGFGTRLGDLTKTTPKPLVPVNDKRIIDFSLYQIKKTNFSEVVINLHYLGEKITNYLGNGEKYGLSIEYSKEDPILDTGGAIKKVLSKYPDRPILVLNSDAIFGTDLDLAGFIEHFFDNPNNPIAQMLLRPPPKPNPFGIIKAAKNRSHGLQVTNILNFSLKTSVKEKPSDYIFPGIHIFSNRISPYLKDLSEIFSSINDLYPLLLRKDEYIAAEIYNGYWQDTGTLERLNEVIEAHKKNIIRA